MRGGTRDIGEVQGPSENDFLTSRVNVCVIQDEVDNPYPATNKCWHLSTYKKATHPTSLSIQTIASLYQLYSVINLRTVEQFIHIHVIQVIE